MTLLLIPLAVVADEILRYLLHHRTGLLTALATAYTASSHHVTRYFRSPGVRVAGRDTPREASA